MIRLTSEWETIIASEATDKTLISKIYKQLMQLNIKSHFNFKKKKMTGYSHIAYLAHSVLPYIDMNQPWVVHVFPILNILFPPPSPSHPSGSSQCNSPEDSVSCIEPGPVIYFAYDNIHVSMLFSQIILPLPSPTESKSPFFTSVSVLLSLI